MADITATMRPCAFDTTFAKYRFKAPVKDQLPIASETLIRQLNFKKNTELLVESLQNLNTSGSLLNATGKRDNDDEIQKLYLDHAYAQGETFKQPEAIAQTVNNMNLLQESLAPVRHNPYSNFDQVLSDPSKITITNVSITMLAGGAALASFFIAPQFMALFLGETAIKLLPAYMRNVNTLMPLFIHLPIKVYTVIRSAKDTDNLKDAIKMWINTGIQEGLSLSYMFFVTPSLNYFLDSTLKSVTSDWLGKHLGGGDKF